MGAGVKKGFGEVVGFANTLKDRLIFLAKVRGPCRGDGGGRIWGCVWHLVDRLIMCPSWSFLGCRRYQVWSECLVFIISFNPHSDPDEALSSSPFYR